MPARGRSTFPLSPRGRGWRGRACSAAPGEGAFAHLHPSPFPPCDLRRASRARSRQKALSHKGRGDAFIAPLGSYVLMARVAASAEIERLIQLLARLPGLGPRSARRAALHLVKKKEQLLAPLAAALTEAHDRIVTCETCGNIDTVSPCTLCRDQCSRPFADLCGGGGRRSLGARARPCAERPLSRARRHAVAARRRRAETCPSPS